MENRRNYYRVLHVQPDAPAAVIKATYRTLMQKLKMHPDLGGDTWNAVLVNEAYSVLSDPMKREQYDQLLLRKLHPGPHRETGRGHCLFCKSIFLIEPGRAVRETCSDCHSPLQIVDSKETKLVLQRMGMRIEESFDITYFTYWPQSPQSAIAMDFSPSGIAIMAKDHFFVGQLIKIESSLLNAVAQVKNHETPVKSPGPVRVGLKFMTVLFNLPRGTFVGVTV